MKIHIILLGLVLCLPLMAADQKPLTKEQSAKVIEAAIRKATGKLTGEITKTDCEKVRKLYLRNNNLIEVPKGLEKLKNLTYLNLYDNKLTNVKSLDKLKQLKTLWLGGNKLTSVKGLEKLTHLTDLTFFGGNPNLSKAQIAQLRKALPKCEIIYFSTK